MLNGEAGSDDDVWLPEEEGGTRTQPPTIRVIRVQEPTSSLTYTDRMNRDHVEPVVLPKRYLEMCTQASKRRSRAASDDHRPLQDRPTRPTNTLPRSFLSSSTRTSTKTSTQPTISKSRRPFNQKDGDGERYNDLNTAIQWLRQEIGSLKQQDKILLRQFLELRALINKLRAHPRTSSCSSTYDVSIHESRTHLNMLPVDERGEPSGSRSNSMLRGEECAVEFRDRTMSMLTTRDIYIQNINRRKAKECL